MQKLLLSILLSALLSLILGFNIDRVVKEDWKMELSYDHIGRDLDVDFTLLENYVALGSADKFNNFVSQLDRQISYIGSPNPCSIARGEGANPLILVNYQKLNLKITMLNKNKNSLLKCEEFIDKRIKIYETALIKIASKLLSYQNSRYREKKAIDEDFELRKSEAQKYFKDNLLNNLNKKNLTLDGGYSESNILKMEALAKNLLLIDLLKKNSTSDDIKVLDFNVNEFIVIKKVYRNLSLKEQNLYLLTFSIFIIIQIIFTLILFKVNIFDKKNLKKNFMKIIK